VHEREARQEQPSDTGGKLHCATRCRLLRALSRQASAASRDWYSIWPQWERERSSSTGGTCGPGEDHGQVPVVTPVQPLGPQRSNSVPLDLIYYIIKPSFIPSLRIMEYSRGPCPGIKRDIPEQDRRFYASKLAVLERNMSAVADRLAAYDDQTLKAVYDIATKEFYGPNRGKVRHIVCGWFPRLTVVVVFVPATVRAQRLAGLLEAL
jgi:hypothetical protein